MNRLQIKLNRPFYRGAAGGCSHTFHAQAGTGFTNQRYNDEAGL